MEKKFEAHRSLPSDPDFEYDKRIDFKAKEKSAWDESESEADQW